MWTDIVKMKTARWKIKGSITRCTTVRSTKKKEEGGWTPTYKLGLLLWVETEKAFLRRLWENKYWSLKYVPRFWCGNYLRISKKLSWSMINNFVVNWMIGRRWNGLGGKMIWDTYRVKALNLGRRGTGISRGGGPPWDVRNTAQAAPALGVRCGGWWNYIPSSLGYLVLKEAYAHPLPDRRSGFQYP